MVSDGSVQMEQAVVDSKKIAVGKKWCVFSVPVCSVSKVQNGGVCYRLKKIGDGYDVLPSADLEFLIVCDVPG